MYFYTLVRCLYDFTDLTDVDVDVKVHVIVVVCGRLIFGFANLMRLTLFFFKSGIPTSKAAVASLQKENESLKEQIAARKQNFVDLQKSLQCNELPTASNGAHSTPSSLDPETSISLQFHSQSYDDLNQFRLNANKEIEKLWSRLNLLSGQVEKVAITIEEIQRYSYQYNIKIIGLPETDVHDSA